MDDDAKHEILSTLEDIKSDEADSIKKLESLLGDDVNINVGDIANANAVAIGKNIDLIINQTDTSPEVLARLDQLIAQPGIQEALKLYDAQRKAAQRKRLFIVAGIVVAIAVLFGGAWAFVFRGNANRTVALVNLPLPVTVNETGCGLSGTDALIEEAGGQLVVSGAELIIEIACDGNNAAFDVAFPALPVHHIDYLPVLETLSFTVSENDARRALEASVLYAVGDYLQSYNVLTSIRMPEQSELALLHGMSAIYNVADDEFAGEGSLTWEDARDSLTASRTAMGYAVTGLTYVYEWEQTFTLGVGLGDNVPDSVLNDLQQQCRAEAIPAINTALNLEERELWWAYLALVEMHCLRAGENGPQLPDVELIMQYMEQADRGENGAKTDQVTILALQSLVEVKIVSDPRAAAAQEFAQDAANIDLWLPIAYYAIACTSDDLREETSNYRAYQARTFAEWRRVQIRAGLSSGDFCA